jgi:stearoyl-CoA desaturase (Delta-9 desaturase)
VLQQLGLVYELRTAKKKDIDDAKAYMQHKEIGTMVVEKDSAESVWDGPRWTKQDLEEYVQQYPSRCVLYIENFVVDVTSYLGEHVSLNMIE